MSHLKDLVIDEMGPGREMVVLGRRVINFGSDSFLGLDQDPRVQQAIRNGLRKWGTHNGSSRAFASVRANIVAEQGLADWLGVESTLIYPSVMLANLGAIPGLTGRQDAIAMDEMAHSSMQEAAKIARAGGTKVATFAHNDAAALEQTLAGLQPYRCALVCIDGVYSMSGKIPPMARAGCRGPFRQGCALHRRCARHRGAGPARAGDGARSSGELRKRVCCRLALEGIFVRRGIHRVLGRVSATAQDSLQLLCFRGAGRAVLSGSHRHGHRHSLLERVRGPARAAGSLDRAADAGTGDAGPGSDGGSNADRLGEDR